MDYGHKNDNCVEGASIFNIHADDGRVVLGTSEFWPITAKQMGGKASSATVLKVEWLWGQKHLHLSPGGNMTQGNGSVLLQLKFVLFFNIYCFYFLMN